MMGARELVLSGSRLTAGWTSAVLDFIFPPLCIRCQDRVGEAHTLCPRCWGALAFIDGALCTRCGLPFEIDPGEPAQCGTCLARSPMFDRARSVFCYDDASRPLVLAFKYADRVERAPTFAQWLDRVGQPFLVDAGVIVPVPLHRWRLWRRRYNQAAILARRLSSISGVPFDPLLLERTRPTPSQGSMPSAKARRRNVLGAFRVAKTKARFVKDRNVLLIDDVYTTGATLEACARALKRAGAARVDALTLARVVKASHVTI